MIREYLIQACSGLKIDVKQGQTITVIDMDGGQVVDFFAEALRLHLGHTIYSNLYNPMLLVLSDDVGEHDLLHPCCRKEMYDFFYHNGKGHPNCLDNINNALGERRPFTTPINLFMHTKIHTDGSLSVEKPLPKYIILFLCRKIMSRNAFVFRMIALAGDKIVFQVLMM